MENVVLAAHGGGGPVMAELVDEITEILGMDKAERHDAALLETVPGRLAFTSDSFVVRPVFFPGGDIGKLAVCGTVNDLAMSGAIPLALSLALIVEEGFPLTDLRSIIHSIAKTAAACRTKVVTGDLKVVGRGEADGIYVNTTGIGNVPPGIVISPETVCVGDAVLVSGPLGAHGAAILAEREGMNHGQIYSDVAPVNELVQALLSAVPETKVLRDPTRGGLAAVLRELAGASSVAFDVEETLLPVDGPVRALCKLFGIDAVHLPCEGRFVAIVPGHLQQAALATLKKQPGGEGAAFIGWAVPPDAMGGVRMVTPFGGRVYLGAGTEELLPRIC